jgi:hypothetical protein
MKDSAMLSYSYTQETFDIHPYISSSIGLVFIPISLLMLLIPFVVKKDDEVSFIIFIIASPLMVFLVAFINYCFAGVCPRYMNDFAPWAALTGALVGLKAIERNDNKHAAVPVAINALLVISIILTFQYHFIGFDGLKIGDFNGLLGIVKTVTNQYNL